MHGDCSLAVSADRQAAENTQTHTLGHLLHLFLNQELQTSNRRKGGTPVCSQGAKGGQMHFDPDSIAVDVHHLYFHLCPFCFNDLWSQV